MTFLKVVELKTFNVLPEYFIGISALYILVVITLISYNVYGLIIQKALSECMGLILLLICYLLVNDELLFSSCCLDFFYTSGFRKASIADYFAFLSQIRK